MAAPSQFSGVPAEHAAFYAAGRFTLNVTRADMVRAGYSPSVRLFEAGAYWRRRKASALATRSKSIDSSPSRRRRR